MITDADIKKMKAVFATKEELKSLDSKMDRGFVDIIEFIGETEDKIIKELNDFRGEANQFRNEMRDINSNNQSTLHNHEARISHLEYNKA
ncbi:hypothetical protein COY90_03120 [Candidatus Roizmanbacteria bacterium CG_4_10_14_0_8_um_filter_39_9]|uniref:Uncharacterized protein n=1 Tax=Candidatus Roizmanbacteria bacterium CG_4_10_14_0_8_um_filter_39_9 TaxID=1974829 RepID=A0A2M7QCL3_9BACT|nr:MAG: hypothetical protein COY90_03120 [Candidatus Roizmanbacteria bacterium CG_4_10_14_0_8_um_filter_39_9]